MIIQVERDLDALLLAVCQNPEDLNYRLVYADLLEETASEWDKRPRSGSGVQIEELDRHVYRRDRAELIRCQIELSRMGGPRKVFTAHDFWFHRNEGEAEVRLDPDLEPASEQIKPGMYLDLILAKEARERGRGVNKSYDLVRLRPYKQEWHGVRVLGIISQSARCKFSFTTDSNSYRGHLLQERAHELLCGKVPWGVMTPQPSRALLWSGVHLQTIYPCVSEYRNGFVWRVWCHEQAWLAHGTRAVLDHPVERVDVTDREPWRDYEDELGTGTIVPDGYVERMATQIHAWGQYGDVTKQDPHIPLYHRLRHDLWRELCNDPRCDWRPGSHWARFNNYNDAKDALALAAVRWARKASKSIPFAKELNHD